MQPAEMMSTRELIFPLLCQLLLVVGFMILASRAGGWVMRDKWALNYVGLIPLALAVIWGRAVNCKIDLLQ